MSSTTRNILPSSPTHTKQAVARLQRTKNSTLRGISTKKMRMKALSGANADASKSTFTTTPTRSVKKVKGGGSSIHFIGVSSELQHTSEVEVVDDSFSCLSKEALEDGVTKVISSSLDFFEDDDVRMIKPNNKYSLMSELEEVEENYKIDKLFKPPTQLESLLTAACVRGSKGMNACGAIKVLTEKEANRVSLAHTKGVVSTLTKVIAKESGKQANLANGVKLSRISNDEDERNVKAISSEEQLEMSLRIYGEASQRSMQALYNLSLDEDNIKLLFYSPGLMSCMLSVIENDRGRLRMLACRVILNTAKNLDIKPLLIRSVKGLILFITTTINSNEEYNSEDSVRYFNEARKCLMKILLELTETPKSSFLLVRHDRFLVEWVNVLGLRKTNIRVDCMKVIANLSRLGENATVLINTPGFVSEIIKASRSSNSQYKEYALFTLLNLSSEASCQELLAKKVGILRSLCKCTLESNITEDNKLIALRTLKNLSHDPRNIIHFANEQCLESIIILATNNDAKSGSLQYIAADILGMVSRYLNALSLFGELKDYSEAPTMNDTKIQLDEFLDEGVSLSKFPTHKVRSYQRT